jgi:FAD/FMN-containing dehydrogenase
MLTGAGKIPGDRILNAFDRLALIVGSQNTLLPADASFGDYLKDETYLQGNAALVLKPGGRDEIAALLQELRALRRDFPEDKDHFTLTLRGGGSGLSGAAVPQGGIVLDLTRMNRILEIDEKNFFARVECGRLLSEIYNALAESPLCYAVDPSSSALCTLGGSIATNAAGPSSLKYGTTRQNLAALRFLSAGGDLVSAGALPVKTSMGFSLPDLICGSEGRLGIILDADIRLVPRAEEIAMVVGAFASEENAMAFILSVKKRGIRPKCIEILDKYSMEIAGFSLKGDALLMIELDGTEDEIDAALENIITLDSSVEWLSAHDEKSRAGLWAKRKSITGELKKHYAFKLGEDIAVPLTALAHTTAFARTRAAERHVKTAIWGHAGDGNLHVNYLLEKADDLPVLDILMQELAHEVTRVGGAVSGEHGLGRLKRKFARAVLPPSYFEMQQRIKNALDPEHLLNPALDPEI